MDKLLNTPLKWIFPEFPKYDIHLSIILHNCCLTLSALFSDLNKTPNLFFIFHKWTFNRSIFPSLQLDVVEFIIFIVEFLNRNLTKCSLLNLHSYKLYSYELWKQKPKGLSNESTFTGSWRSCRSTTVDPPYSAWRRGTRSTKSGGHRLYAQIST